MSAASVLPSQISEEFKVQFLTCSICYEPYDKREHQAKCLPCLHTFCLSCLKRLAGRRPKLNCPKCRKEIILPGGTVNSLVNNFLVENLKEYQDLINHAVLCGDCDDEHQAVSFCHDCSLFLCTICVNIHRRKRSQRQHKLSTMQELQQQNFRPRNEQVCQRHPAQALTLYCKNAACKVPVCASCGLVDHRSHELIDLSTAIDEIIAEIKQFSARVNGKTQELAKARETVATEQNKLTRNSEQKIKDINEIKDKLFIMINLKCSQATSRVKQLCDSEMGNLTGKVELIDTINAQMISACDFANKACDMNHPTQLLTSQHQIVDRLRELENADLPKTSSDKTDFTFTDNHLLALTKIQESVQQLCGIAWKQHTLSGIRSNQARFKPGSRRIPHLGETGLGISRSDFDRDWPSSSSDDTRTIECQVCFTLFPHNQLMRLYFCDNCLICSECLTGHFIVVIQQKNIMEATCPACGKPDVKNTADMAEHFTFLDTLLRTLIDAETHALFLHKLRDWKLQEEENFRWCAHCRNGFINEAPERRKMRCPECAKITCFNCRKPWLEQHDNITCLQFELWKRDNDYERQVEGVAGHLKYNGIDCPSCKMRYKLAKGGSMHFKCPQCMLEFCCGCNKPYMAGNECGKLPSCARNGLHAHHPRDCLFHLRVWEVTKLQKLLHKHRIQYDTEPPQGNAGQRQSCLVLEEKETPEGLDDGPCGRETLAKHAGLCRLHYTEYLVLLINENLIDPAETFDPIELNIVLTRNEIVLPSRRRGESDQEYQKTLLKKVQERLPFCGKPPRDRP